jgi:hypothetical protein
MQLRSMQEISLCKRSDRSETTGIDDPWPMRRDHDGTEPNKTHLPPRPLIHASASVYGKAGAATSRWYTVRPSVPHHAHPSRCHHHVSRLPAGPAPPACFFAALPRANLIDPRRPTSSAGVQFPVPKKTNESAEVIRSAVLLSNNRNRLLILLFISFSSFVVCSRSSRCIWYTWLRQQYISFRLSGAESPAICSLHPKLQDV